MPHLHQIPPDLAVGPYSRTHQNLWHLPSQIWNGIWDFANGEGIKVAVLDTGYTGHPDLVKPVAERSFTGEPVRDHNGHGSHCCGTATGRNGIGVAKGASLIVGKVLSNRGSGSSEGIADGIKWAVDAGADVVSLSLGANSSYPPTEKVLEYAWKFNCIPVCAAGNSGFNGTRNTIGWPARWNAAVCVGATQENGKIAGFSSGGREMDVAAPGQNIVSASHRGNGYSTKSGTSMAAPFIAGLLALVKGIYRRRGLPEWSSIDDFRTWAEAFSDDRGAPGHDPSFGVGVPLGAKIVEHLAAGDVDMLTNGGPAL